VLDRRDGALPDLATSKPVQIDPRDAERLHFPTGLAAPTVVVPVQDKIRRFALALYGPHASGADLAPDERAVLAGLASDAALAYRGAEAAMLRRRVADLELRLAEANATAPDSHEGVTAVPEPAPVGPNGNGPV
jgi:hypothetical protein